jgi:streptomycin 6-kinase
VDNAFVLPTHFVRTITDTWGEPGRVWLAGLPERLVAVEARWGLRLEPPYPNLSYHYVAPVWLATGEPAVLKLGVPRPELALEIAVLRAWDGRGMVRLLDAEAEAGWLLLERLAPGQPLTGLAHTDDDAATRIAAGLMQQLWQPVPAGLASQLPTIATWSEGFERLRAAFGGGTGPFPPHLVDIAEQVTADHLASPGPAGLLHGDLHHDNILAARRQPWLALDPQGLVGEAEYEIGPLLINPLDVHTWPDLGRVEARRLDLLAERLGFDRQRLWGWGVARAVLSAWWTWEGEGERLETSTLAVAEAIAEQR